MEEDILHTYPGCGHRFLSAKSWDLHVNAVEATDGVKGDVHRVTHKIRFSFHITAKPTVPPCDVGDGDLLFELSVGDEVFDLHRRQKIETNVHHDIHGPKYPGKTKDGPKTVSSTTAE